MTECPMFAPEPPFSCLYHRSRRLAWVRTIRDLRLSVAQGRPISLPNLLRLLQRRFAELDPNFPADRPRDAMRRFYHAHQPFTYMKRR